MTEDMPEDVKAHARELWAQAGAIDADPPYVIAYAILAERRRCAAVLSQHVFPHPTRRHSIVIGKEAEEAIAAAIRGDGHGEG